MILLFAMTLETNTKEATFAGNLTPQEALNILQSIIISEAVKKAKEEKKDAEPTEDKPETPQG